MALVIYQLVKVHDPKNHARPILIRQDDFNPAIHKPWDEEEEVKADTPPAPTVTATVKTIRFKKRDSYSSGATDGFGNPV